MERDSPVEEEETPGVAEIHSPPAWILPGLGASSWETWGCFSLWSYAFTAQSEVGSRCPQAPWRVFQNYDEETPP